MNVGKYGNLIVLAFSLVLFASMLLIGELYCRFFTDIPLLGTSVNLLIKKTDGTNLENAKNASGISFGEKVYTDHMGFRIPPGYDDKNRKYSSAILILGDSTGFGPSVKEEKIAAGLLRTNLPDTKIYNSCVIGYCTDDYKSAARSFLLSNSDIKAAYLLYCLNDVYPNNPVFTNKAYIGSVRPGLVDSMKKLSFIDRLNNLLRAHSRLYVFLKGVLTNTCERYWLSDYFLYAHMTDSELKSKLQPIFDIADMMKRRGIYFKVIIIPYEYQVSNDDPAIYLPNTKIISELDQAQTGYMDLLPVFRSSGVPAGKLFLRYDGIHLSATGHKIVYEAIAKDLRSAERAH
jgi:hypothetical protein